MNHILSKSRFISGKQCLLRLWYETYERNLASEPDSTLQQVFETGHQVGNLACERYPGGFLIGFGPHEVQEALDSTADALASAEVMALYEPAFTHEGVYVRVDILEPLKSGGWRLIEVKSTLNVKDTHVLDAAIQHWVLVGAGLDIRDVGVLTLNRDYVYAGGDYDLDQLFKLHSVLDRTSAMLDWLGEDVNSMKAILAAKEPPNVSIGPHCFNPYHCPFYTHCSKDHVFPEHGFEELHRFQHESVLGRKLAELGITKIRDIPSDIQLSPLRRRIRTAVIDDQAQVGQNLPHALSEIKSPIRYLDFETFAPALPRYKGTHPYEKIPFQFSVHLENDDGSIEHFEYLHEDSDDPRPRLVEELLQALDGFSTGSICVYSSYEKRVINDLTKAVPARATELLDAIPRLFDLHALVRQNYYHPQFHGSFSLKNVIPVLVPRLDYKDLTIADGQSAANDYETALNTSDVRQRQQIFDDLRTYCARDTLSLVELRRSLIVIAEKGFDADPKVDE